MPSLLSNCGDGNTHLLVIDDVSAFHWQAVSQGNNQWHYVVRALKAAMDDCRLVVAMTTNSLLSKRRTAFQMTNAVSTAFTVWKFQLQRETPTDTFNEEYGSRFTLAKHSSSLALPFSITQGGIQML